MVLLTNVLQTKFSFSNNIFRFIAELEAQVFTDLCVATVSIVH